MAKLNYREHKERIRTLHRQLKEKHGRANHCESPDCPKISSEFHWAKKKRHQYTANPKDYLQLCRLCHHKYDYTKKNRKAHIASWPWFKEHGKLKLNKNKAKRIRRQIAKGQTMYSLGKEYGVDKTTIRDIRDNRIWKV